MEAGGLPMPKIKAPTYFLWGAHDQLIGVQSARWFAQHIAGSDLIVYPDAGHLPMEEVALQSAANYRRLRRQGVTIRKAIDVMIATFCITNNHALLHRDRDFDPMERWLGLKVVG